MKIEEYEIMYNVEESHWWYLGMQKITTAVLERWYQPGSGLRILDAGCGTGAHITSYLANYGEVIGMDASQVALHYSKKRQIKTLLQASIDDFPLCSGTFDLVTSFDVLYYARNDFETLLEFKRVLKKDGRLLLRLPAYEWLKGSHDKAVDIKRRYTARQVSSLLEQAGFVVEHGSYANTFLFPFAILKRMLDRLINRKDVSSDLTTDFGSLNQLLKHILMLESGLVKKQRLPYGLTVVAVGKKAQE